jgi:leucyl aminopeptidase
MNINFVKNYSKDSLLTLIFTEESIKTSKLKFVKFAKENLDFSGKFGQAHLVNFNDKIIALVGAGEAKTLDETTLQKLGAKTISFLNSSKIKNATIVFDYEIDEKGNLKSKKKDDKKLCNIAFGAALQGYRFNKYFEKKKSEKELKTETISILCDDVSAAKKEFIEFDLLAKNIFFVRDLVSEPANILNPDSYTEICKSLKKDGLEVEILEEAEMKKLGMHALLGVGQGSDKRSRLVILKWNGLPSSKEKPLAFVGKGVTFDTGGVSIKPANNMEDMKTDMAGSAVVIGLMRLFAQRKAKVNAVGVLGIVENMCSGSAQRPGDIVKSMSGQTIEVINTDAEGRLVLADALHYTITKFKPRFVVDLATLTGAIVVCLADVYAGLFSNDDKLAKEIESSGKSSGERVWRLPLAEEYDEMINSDVADMKNVGSGRGAGSTTAAQFLKRFVGETKWAHLDIAGVAYKGKGDSLAIRGATGYGVRLLNQLVKDFYE